MLGNFRAFDWNFRLHTLQKSGINNTDMGDFACGSGLPVKMHRLWTSDYDRTKACRKKYKRNSKKSLNAGLDIVAFLLLNGRNQVILKSC